MMADQRPFVRYWRHVRALTAALLLLWLAASFVVVFFARELSSVTLWGWPLHSFLAAQGVALVYLAITGIYALAMKHIDRRAQREDGNES